MTAFSYLALAARLGALSPTATVQADPERMAQWTTRLLLAGLQADRGEDPAEMIAEANRYSGRPAGPQPWPGPMIMSIGLAVALGVAL